MLVIEPDRSRVEDAADRLDSERQRFRRSILALKGGLVRRLGSRAGVSWFFAAGTLYGATRARRVPQPDAEPPRSLSQTLLTLTSAMMGLQRLLGD